MKPDNALLSVKQAFSAGASFRIQGLDLPFNDITQKLIIDPTRTHRRGDPGLLRAPLPRDMWMLQSPLNDSCELGLHLEWLAERLLPHRQYISTLQQTLAVDIYCFKTCYTEQASLVLPPHALRIFTELGIELQVSLIFLPNEADEETEKTGDRRDVS